MMLLSSIFLLSSLCIVQARPGQAGARLGRARAEYFSWLGAVGGLGQETRACRVSESCDVRDIAAAVCRVFCF